VKEAWVSEGIVCKIRILESVVYGSGYISIAFGYECRKSSSI